MRAVVQDRYGSSRDLHIAELPDPRPGEGEVLVRVAGASVHADVWHVVTGRPYLLARPLAGGLRRPRDRVPGTDLAGVVTAVGPGATRFGPGDRVFGEVVNGNQWHNGGTFAELASVAETVLERVPDEVSLVEAAAIPTSGLIAYNQVVLTGIGPGDRVLVNGAGGGVGVFALQIAKARGAHVTAVDAADREELLRSIGADRFVDYRRTDFTAEPYVYDAVIDIPGNHPYRRITRVLADDGRYVLVGHDRYGSAGRWWGSLPPVLGRMVRDSVRRRERPSFSATPEGALRELAALAADGSLHPVVAQTFPLEQVVAAMAALESGSVRGKIVLTA